MTLTDAYQTVHFGDIPDSAVFALFQGVPLVDKRRLDPDAKDPAGNHDVVLWDGQIPRKLGRFWNPNPHSCFAARRAAAIAQADYYRWGTGLNAETVARVCWLFGECDDRPMAEQIAQVEILAEILGQPALAVLSGDTRDGSQAKFPNKVLSPGKSVHVYWALEPFSPTPELTAQWVKAQRMLAVLLDGDLSIADLPRKMRTPGAKATSGGEIRLQTVLLATPGLQVPLADLTARLERAGLERGVSDWDAAIARRLAEHEILHRVTQGRLAGDAAQPVLALLAAGDWSEGTQAAYAALVPRLSPRAGTGTGKGSRGHLDPATVVYRDGAETTIAAVGAELVPMGRTVTTSCPLHDHRASHGVSHGRNGAGSHFVTCWSPEGGTWWVQDADFVDMCESADTTQAINKSAVPTKTLVKEKFNDPEVGSTVATPTRPVPKPRKLGDKYRFATVTRYTPDSLTAGRYLPATPPAEGCTVLYLRGDKGCGKTEFLAGLVASMPGSDVLAIVHRRTLATNLAHRLGILDYQTQKSGELTESVAVCIDSLHRVATWRVNAGGNVDPRSPDIVFVDEIQQVLRAFYSGKMSPGASLEALTRLREWLRAAQLVVVADADLDALTVNFLTETLGAARAQGQGELRVAPLRDDWRYVQHSTTAELDTELLDAWTSGKRIAVALMANLDSARVQKLLQNSRPTAKVACITAEEWTESRGEISADPNGWAKGYDAVVYSPSLGTGFSFDLTGHFDRIFGYFYSDVGTAQDAAQMLHRVRNPVNREIHWWAAPQYTPRLVDPQAIRALALSIAKRTHAALATDVAVYDLFDSGKPLHAQHFYLWGEVISYLRRYGAQGCGIGGALARYLGVRSTVAQPHAKPAVEVVRELSREARKDVVFRDAEAVANAEVRDLANLPREASNRKERLEGRAAHIAEFYGVAEVPPELVLQDDRGRFRSKVRSFAQQAVYQQGNRKASLRRDAVAAASGTVVAFRHVDESARILAGLLAKFGIDWDRLVQGDTTPLDSSGWSAAVAALVPAATLLSELGHGIPRDAPEKPAKYVQSLLGSIGIALTRERVRDGGERQSVFALDPVSVQKMVQLSAAEYHRLTADKPTPQPAPAAVSADRAEQLDLLFSEFGGLA